MRNVIRRLALCALLLAVFVTPTQADPREEFDRGMRAASTGDFDGAIGVFTSLIDTSQAQGRNLANLYNVRGLCLAEKGDLQKALADLDKAVELDGKFAEALANRAFIKKAAGDLAGGKADAQAALRFDRKVKVPEF